jgi:N-methylhydantoinase B
VHITNTSNLPVEAIEMEYPLLVESYSLIEDSGGPGRFRGGLGLRRAIRPVGHNCAFNGAIERSAHNPWGIFGGGSGAPGRFLHVAADGKPKMLPTKPAGMLVRDSETIVVESPGAGGYGAPSERRREAISADQASGKFSKTYLDRWYSLPRAAE